MDTTLTQKFPFILDRNLAKANCTGNHVCTFCDKVVLDDNIKFLLPNKMRIIGISNLINTNSLATNHIGK